MDIYEKKYKEAQGWIEKIYPTLQHEQQMEAEAFFPELKESENEKIRKTLIRVLNENVGNGIEKYGAKLEDALAWLEKQGEQETDEWKEGNIIRHGGILALVIKGRRALKSNGELFTVQYPNEWVKAVPNEIERFLNELEKQGEQKPAEWSEEDEVKINRIVACLENLNVADNDILLKDVDWLKSLKDRYTWKPSDEQMEALESATENCAYSEYQDCLRELIEQLNKLKS